LTTGLNSGVAKLVGEAISQDRMITGRPNNVVSIGLTKWGCLTERTRNLLSEQVQWLTEKYSEYNIFLFSVSLQVKMAAVIAATTKKKTIIFLSKS
jgi:hypothetical protein